MPLRLAREYSKKGERVDRLQQRLDALVAGCDADDTRSRDPVDFVHRYRDPRDQEVVALIAASLAFGNALAARRSIDRALQTLGPRPGAVVVAASRDDLGRRLRGFVHRIYRGEHLALMLWQAGVLIRHHGSLGASFLFFHSKSGGVFRESMALFADALRGEANTRSMRHLVSDPRAGSACKRLLLYARWMVRPADGIDLGLWPIPPSELIIPVDTHVHRISRNLGLTRRRTASWATAEEITAALRRLDPHDPVKYDFALCHLGISRDCPSRPDLTKCERCVVRDVCGAWGTRRSPRSAQKARELRL